MKLFKKKKPSEPLKKIIYTYWEIMVYFKDKVEHLVVIYEGDSAEKNSLEQLNGLIFSCESRLNSDGNIVRIAPRTIEMAYRIKKTRSEET